MAVSVKNLCFGYGTNQILNRVNLHVEKAIIFGLLGPSGCGKTTLLKTIIGFNKPTSGTVSVFGFTPGTDECGIPGNVVGFMPQELAVQTNLTIEEIFKYFGRIQGMAANDVKIEMNKLLKLLELPDKNRIISRMSGGQIRRVSLAITMLHKPQLLILDEPTVGVDPLLTEVIWNFMYELSVEKNITIIITTHYIEETMRANAVAFMRKGEILEQNYPKRLLEKYEVLNLDEVFLKLCVQQKEKRKDEKRKRRSSYFALCVSKEQGTTKTEFEQVIRRLKPEFKLKKFMNISTAIILKYFVETLRNPLSMIFSLMMTISVICAVEIVYGKTPKDLSVAWVVDEINRCNFNYSENCGRTIANDFNAVTNSINRGINTSHDYSDYMFLPDLLKSSINQKIINLIKYSNIHDAMKDAKKKTIAAVIHLQANFSDNYLESDQLFALNDGSIDNDTIVGGSIHLHLDFAGRVIADTIRYTVLKAIMKFREKMAEIYEINPLLTKSIFSFRELQKGVEEEVNIDDEDLFGSTLFITPGIAAINVFSFGLMVSIFSYSNDKESDMFLRCFASGVKSHHIVSGQVIARFMFLIPNVVLTIIIMIYVMDVPCRGSIFLIITLSIMQMLTGILFGSLLAPFMGNSHFGLSAVIAVSLTMMASNGILWGIETQPYYTKWISEFSVLHKSLKSIRRLLTNSTPPVSILCPTFGVTLVWIAVLYIASLIVVKVNSV